MQISGKQGGVQYSGTKLDAHVVYPVRSLPHRIILVLFLLFCSSCVVIGLQRLSATKLQASAPTGFGINWVA